MDFCYSIDCVQIYFMCRRKPVDQPQYLLLFGSQKSKITVTRFD